MGEQMNVFYYGGVYRCPPSSFARYTTKGFLCVQWMSDGDKIKKNVATKKRQMRTLKKDSCLALQKKQAMEGKKKTNEVKYMEMRKDEVWIGIDLLAKGTSFSGVLPQVQVLVLQRSERRVTAADTILVTRCT
jgi:hypothetical protein